MFERRKGEWGSTYPKRIADHFLQQQQPETLEEIFRAIYPGEEANEKGIAKLYQHMVKARKVLRGRGKFITDPRKNGGKYGLEKDPEGILKQTKTGEVRASNGVDIMECGGMALMEDRETRAYGISVTKSLSKFIMRVTENYISQRIPKPEILDKVDRLEDSSAPQLPNPSLQ